MLRAIIYRTINPDTSKLRNIRLSKILVLLNLYSTIIFAEKKLWIVQDVEA